MTSPRARGRMISRLRQHGIADEAVLAAMGAVPRHIFVDEALAHRAYEESALPIGFHQTLSRPGTVARMLEILRAGRASLGRTLEIGSGSGYQTAVLGRLSSELYAAERIAPLLARARSVLSNFPELRHVRLRHADGAAGWADSAPFDSIIVAAAAPFVPPSLRAQLSHEGVLVLPVGEEEQYLYRIRKTARGFSEEKLDPVRFVPLLAGIEK
ncbi:MAG: protein-L-isoaspartate(D-aspartate) O-methyltransferase [Zoogloeaceae bacterium]|jgi:protein-L-isoaspartate(D-aspartate) O-methyltransferase|nr:protein-L-isoaspartate(D-aspartate) O-methyltransferase [Zoogloeaceae bacterium]